MDKLVQAINISGTTHIIISKIDVLEKVNIFKYFYQSHLTTCKSLLNLMQMIRIILNQNCPLLKSMNFSNNPETI